ncbi:MULTISPECIES: family 43 glycosylhydrolase [Streptomyces]|uniref:Arabinan endo-1,5-alpha-L-arabinosidase n=1 Tax=Streptomyces dengpaensis TaxID=2049881 RepID=A0ABM6SKH5_9ACTN|nr:MULTISPECIES: family 43 glycosylhydrolase [Streptomyces]AVH55083.1 arabinan endo-1,5-alpha-L-arabinosidase [Streptomyces dengpaensis]PIB08383.1 arabinan endo-1,5-alpha-L-arabinosidase [Streptomyces sp. HG99]
MLLTALAGTLLAALLPAHLATAAPAPESPAGVRQSATYRNPVTADTVDTFPDPALLRGKDGNWYAYGTQNPVFQSKGETGERMLPILKSADMTHWEYAGEVFTPATQPAWHNGSRLWAPDIRYTNGIYTLYYSVPGKDTVGVATAPTPTGPWTDRGAVLPTPSGCATGNIDQAQFTDVGGQPYLYWGSYDTICVAKMNGDRTRIEGPVTEVAQGRRMEGAFVVRRGGFYYLFYSDAGCCDGAFSGYQVKVGRATSPTGPFRDDEGVDLMAPTSKGGIVVGAGSGWAGPGHNALQTDLSGQDWLVYHGIPATDPDLDRFPGLDRQLSRRPMLIDRLDWIDGWPVVRAGAGPSEGVQRAPVTTWAVGSTFNGGSLSGWRAEGSGTDGWVPATEQDPGGFVTHTGSATGPAYLVSESKAPARLRAEADLRVTSASGAAGLLVGYVDPDNYVVAWLDKDRNALVTDVRVNGVSAGERVSALPSGYQWSAWRNVAVEVRGTHLTVEVSADRLRDAVATQERTLPAAAARAGKAGIATRGTGAAADNVGAAQLYTPVTSRVPDPQPGARLPAYSDDFDGSALSPAWSWVRGPASGTSVGAGALSWPTQSAELYLGNNTASVLTRPAPQGDYVVETKLRFAPGTSNQQAGLVLYGNDDQYLKLVHAVLPVSHHPGAVTHVTEFAREGARPTTSPPLPVAYGPMFGGPTADTLWLRLSCHRDGTSGAHEVRAATSTDGSHWAWTGAWTLPDEGPLRIGLVSLNTAGATAHFDYVHTYRVR